jgi:hypothetical protein
VPKWSQKAFGDLEASGASTGAEDPLTWIVGASALWGVILAARLRALLSEIPATIGWMGSPRGQNAPRKYDAPKGKRADGIECVWAYIYWERDSQEAPFKHGVGFDLWPANRDKFGAAMDAAVEKPPFGDDEWWCWDREGAVSCYVELEDNRLTPFAPELDRLIARVTEVVRSIENVAEFFRR